MRFHFGRDDRSKSPLRAAIPNRSFAILALVFTAFLVGGCAARSPDRGFANVSQAGQLRTGAAIRWNQDDASSAAIHDAVDAMLRTTLTADQAVQIALFNNQSLQATYEDLGISRAQVVEAGLMRNPTLSAELRFPRYAALPFEVDLVQSFLDALMIPVRKQIAEADYQTAQARVTAAVVNMAADVRVAFYRAQAASQTAELRQKILEATDAALDAAQRLHDAGNITDLSLLSQHAAEAQARIDLAGANTELQDAREAVSALLGLWGAQTQWTMDAHLPELPTSEIEPSGLEARAMRQRADLQAQLGEVQVATAALYLTQRTAGISDVSIGGKVVQDSDGDLTAGPSVSIPLPIFNQGQAAIVAAQSRVAQARKRYAALAVQIRSDVRRDRARLLAARQRAAYFKAVVLPLRRQIVQQTQLESNAMVVGLFELLMARQSEIDAARQWIGALGDYWIAHAELERALGGRLPAPHPTTQPSTALATQPVPHANGDAERNPHAHPSDHLMQPHEGAHP